jgi:cAMP-specific phosphodiesterase 4
MAIKAADLGHLCDPTPVHRRWVEALEEEFFRQGDAEKACGLPVTPLFDRSKPGVIKSQLAFMDIVAVPLYQAMAQAFPSTQALLEGVSITIVVCVQKLYF